MNKQLLNKQWVFATGNLGKLRELQLLARAIDVEVVTQQSLGLESPEETGETFVENAILKARAAAKASDLPALADDSGLVVPALNGAPGVISARYAGVDASDQANINKLLTAMKGLVGEERAAFFVCVIVLMRSACDPLPLIVQECWHGVILDAPAGSNGFGYDPVFYLPSLQKTAAELDAPTKSLLSHRGQAFRKLIERVNA